MTSGERPSASRIVISFETYFKSRFQRPSFGYCGITAPVKWIEAASEVLWYAPKRPNDARKADRRRFLRFILGKFSEMRV